MRKLELSDIRALVADLPSADLGAEAAARARQDVLTKPAGSLGRLEDLAIWLAAWQGRARPSVARTRVVVFAGNHGVTARGVSAFPAEVTVQMVANFEHGGAAINQLCRLHDADLTVLPLELDRPTADFTVAPAMTEGELGDAIATGMAAVSADTDLLILGEMGIGNTTVAAALASALLGGEPGDWCGAGTGVDGAGLDRKRLAVAEGLARHRAILGDPLEVLRCLGGRELAAMFGALLAARRARVPVLLDGYVVGAAAAVLYRLAPGDGLAHIRAGHVSAEPGHRRMLRAFGMEPLLDLGMRLGEGSGAAVALGLVKAAIACHDGMATFGEAGVAEKS